jgi:hypothetical protein
MVLFADDTSIIITDTNKLDFNIDINQTFQDINTWFNVNLLTLNFNKTHYLEFRTKITIMLILKLITIKKI